MKLRDEGAPALLPVAVPALHSSALAPPGSVRVSCGRRRLLPVLAGSLGLGLQAALVQLVGVLALQFQSLSGRRIVAGLAVAVVPPAQLYPPAEALHHRAVPGDHEVRHVCEQCPSPPSLTAPRSLSARSPLLSALSPS